MMKKKQVVRRMGGGPMKKQVVRRKGGGTARPRQIQTVNSPGGQGVNSLIGQHKRMAMGLIPYVGSRKLKKIKKQTPNDRLDEKLGMKDGKESSKSQSMKSRRDESRAMKRGGVVKKRGGGTMTPMQMRRGGNTSRMNDLEELGRVDAERARTSKGKKNLTAEKNRIILELARKRKPKGRLNVDDITRATNTSTQRRSELSGMSKKQMLEKAYNLAKKRKPGGRLNVDDITRATNTSTQRRSELSGMSKDQMLEKAYNLAKKIKPTGRLSLDDLKRAMKNLKK